MHSKVGFAANPVDMIVVLGHEKLNLELSKIFGQSPVQIVKVPKSGGVRIHAHTGG